MSFVQVPGQQPVPILIKDTREQFAQTESEPLRKFVDSDSQTTIQSGSVKVQTEPTKVVMCSTQTAQRPTWTSQVQTTIQQQVNKPSDYMMNRDPMQEFFALVSYSENFTFIDMQSCEIELTAYRFGN